MQNVIWGTEDRVFVLENERRAGVTEIVEVNGMETLVSAGEEERNVRTEMEENGRRRDS